MHGRGAATVGSACRGERWAIYRCEQCVLVESYSRLIRRTLGARSSVQAAAGRGGATDASHPGLKRLTILKECAIQITDRRRLASPARHQPATGCTATPRSCRPPTTWAAQAARCLLLRQTTAAVARNTRLKMLCPVLLHSSPGPLPSRHALLSLVARAWRTPSRPDSYLCVSCALAALQLRVDVSAVNEPNRGRCAARDAQGTQRPKHRTQRAVARRQRRFSLHLRRWMPAYMLAATSPRARPCPRAASRCATWRAGSQRR